MTRDEQAIFRRLEYCRGVIAQLTKARFGLADWDKEYRKVKGLISRQFGQSLHRSYALAGGLCLFAARWPTRFSPAGTRMRDTES